MPFDAHRAYQHVQRLAFPRRTGSEGARQAADYVAAEFARLGLAVEREPFTFSSLPQRAGKGGLLMLGLALLGASLLIEPSPWGAVVLALGSLGLLPLLTRWNRGVEKLFSWGPQQPGENVLARWGPDGAAAEIVLLAHYDSKSQTFPLALRVVQVQVTLLLMLAVVSLILASALRGPPVVAPAWLKGGTLGVGGLLLLLALGRTGNRSPGALDNASGVAVLLELARSLTASRVGGLKFTFLATDAEEEGLAGALRYIQRHAAEHDRWRTFFLNLDLVGDEGPLRIVSRYGLPPLSTGRRLTVALKEAAQEMGVPVREVYLPLGAGTDQIPLAAWGFEAVTLQHWRWFGPVLAVHSPQDTADHVSPAALRETGEVVWRMIEKSALTSGSSPSPRGKEEGGGN
ncbi:MAG TPA: M28 family peptidase [Armatimonadetes bacterium]|nr:M28 family peptidase [Armatimonadota bacterium]